MDDKHPTQSQNTKESQKAAFTPGEQGQPAANARRVFSKRWLYPAIYLGAAALIIGLMYIKSQVGTHPTLEPNVEGTGGQPATSQTESYAWPVAQGVVPTISMGFFPENGTDAQRAQAIVQYDGGFYPHKGIDIKSGDGGAFDVTAAASGKVTKVTDPSHSLMGWSVEVTSPDGNIEQYESLSRIDVKAGEDIRQGQIIGTSGTSDFEKAQGNHLYFEVDHDGQPVDPTTVLPKQ